MVAYRTRLDTTTNWAVVASAGLITFTLGDKTVPHYVLLMAVFLSTVFLTMEARRYRFYELARRRVRLLEAGFYAEVLGGQPADWITPLRESLTQPQLPITLLQALTVRLRSAYLGLLGIVYAAWLLKLYLLQRPFPESAQIGIVPGWVVLSLAALALLGLLLLTGLQAVREED